MIVATAGHIDHGKSTLVRALTGVDTDRLPEEKARGISIDLGFAYWRTPGDGLTVGFVDVPGHERFVRNMLAGVCGIDYVMLVVAADDGVMPQTVEHLQIVDLLSVTRGIAVITKVDRVPPGRVQEVAASVRALLAPTGLAALEVLEVSAVSGAGLEALRSALARSARSPGRQEQAGRHFRLAIDRVFSVAGSGTVVTGTVFSGGVAPGDRLVLAPAGKETRVRGIQMDRKAAARAVAGERCALNLTGIELAEAARGDWLVSPALHAPTRRVDVRLRVLGSGARAIRHWTPVHLYHGALDVTARVSLRRGGEIRPGHSALAQLVLDQPVAALHGDRFIIRDQSALRTLGGGTVLDPGPGRRRNAAHRAAHLAALELDDPAQVLPALQASSPAGVDLSWFARIFNLDDSRLAELVRSSGLEVLGREPRIGLPRPVVEAIKVGVTQELARFHAATPQALGLDVVELRKRCAPEQSAAAFQVLVRMLADEKQIEFTGSVVRLAAHVATDNPADASMWERVQPALDAAGFGGLMLAELVVASGIREPALKDFLHRKTKTGGLFRVTAERFYLRATLARVAAIARDVSQAQPGGRFSAAQVRDRTDIGRTRVIEILECLDRLGITRRIGDVRVMHKDYVPILGAAPGPGRPVAKP